MSFGCFQFLPNNEQKQVDLRYHSSKVEFFRSFFGRIEDTRVLLESIDLYKIRETNGSQILKEQDVPLT